MPRPPSCFSPDKRVLSFHPFTSRQSHMALYVQKFGGTSVGSVERIKAVAEKVKRFRDNGHQVVVVVSAMGKLFQQDVEAAPKALLEVLKDEEPRVRSQAVLGLGTGYWHTPDKVPEKRLEALTNSSQDTAVEVRRAAFSAIYGLAEVGCSRALELLDS